jgi:O-antigen/teichoic acid export membrane protein
MGLFKNAASVLGTTVVGLPVRLVGGIVLARYLTLEDRGVFGVAVALTGLLMVAGNVGWPSGVVFRIRRAKVAPSTVATTALCAALLFSLVLVALFSTFSEAVRHQFLDGAPAVILVLALVIFPMQLMGSFFCGVARGVDRFDLHNAYNFWIAVARTVFFVIALVALGGGTISALMALVATYAIGVVGVVGSVVRHTGLDGRFSPREFTATLGFGLKAWIHALAGNVHERIDVFMLSSTFLFGEFDQVALYIQAVAVLRLIRLIPDAIGAASLPHLASADPDNIVFEVSRVVRHSCMLVTLASVPLLLVGPWLVPFVYGSQYQGSVTPMLILLPGVTAQTVYVVMTRYWVAIDRQGVNILTQCITMPLNLGLNVALIPLWGIHGAAVASLISYFAESAVIVYFFWRKTKAPLSSLFIPRWEDVEVYKRRIDGLIARFRT